MTDIRFFTGILNNLHIILQICYNSTDNILDKNVICYTLILACYVDNI